MSFLSSKGIKTGFVSAFFCVLIFAAVRSPAAAEIMLAQEMYRPGVYSLQTVLIPENAREVTVRVKREGWADTKRDVISVRMEFSGDNGKTWGFLFGFKTSGGELKDKKGEPVTSSWMTFVIPGGNHTGRKIKGSLEIYSPLATEVSIDFE